MNSLNILSSRVSPSASPQPSRSNSLAHIGFATSDKTHDESRDQGQDGDLHHGHPPYDDPSATSEKHFLSDEPEDYSPHDDDLDHAMDVDEKSPLLGSADDGSNRDASVRSSSWHSIPRRLASGFINSFRWVLSTIAAPGVYFIACFYDHHGNFAPLRHLWRLMGFAPPDGSKAAALAASDPEKPGSTAAPFPSGARGGHAFTAMRPAPSSGTSSSGLSSESESDMTQQRAPGSRRGSASGSASSRHARSKSQPAEETVPARRSIRIKLNNDDAMRQRKHKKAQSVSAAKNGSGDGLAPTDLSSQLKSPTSPYNALTKYPKSPAPPRPLIPRRQPSYVPFEPDTKHLKTLILDLDETLIHSMSKGGRMGSGHMVEVRLNTTYVGSGGQSALGPQHPILYYVHKRPYCDEFLRKICKWFNLVIFTASVQEYADPVIDWLESERKFFTARYYRQHCTFRHGAYIKDLSSVEPDLSKVMILDNSPLSYMFHQDNAIPIQGWISDPTDNDLLHLVPLLEGLQYVSDVRALLTLRGGEDGQHV